VLTTRGDLLDAHPDLRISGRTGHVVGPVVAVAREVARYLDDELRTALAGEDPTGDPPAAGTAQAGAPGDSRGEG